MNEHRGSWIVCVRDIPAGEDTYLGFFIVEQRARDLAERLRRDIAARGAEGVMDAIVEWVRPHPEFEDFRDEMLRGLEECGYDMVPLAKRDAPGFEARTGWS